MYFIKGLFLLKSFFFFFPQVKGIEFFRLPLHKNPSLSLIIFIVLFLFPCNIVSQQGMQNIKYSYEYRFSMLFPRHLNISISTDFSPGGPAIVKGTPVSRQLELDKIENTLPALLPEQLDLPGFNQLVKLAFLPSAGCH